jgi:MFS family permease
MRKWPWGMTGYQWAVVFAAWLGWGFDIIDALLFNYVAENCIPTLLKLPIGSPEGLQATKLYTGYLTSVLLLGWAVGGIFFGWLADKIGRTKTLVLTIVVYSLGTALCAAATNVQFLFFCRTLASLGIGGEWAAGAAVVSEVVPASRRADAGALLYTAAPFGLICAALINKVVVASSLGDHPEYSWRVVFLFGLLPALAAMAMRMVLKEPEAKHDGPAPSLLELFSPQLWRITRSGILMAVTALLSWWTLTAFMPYYAGALAKLQAQTQGMSDMQALHLAANWKFRATALFSVGGFIGTLLTVPLANIWGRKVMFGCYFSSAALVIMATFGLNLAPEPRLGMQFLLGLTVFGVFGSFTYYLPELFPGRLRATGSGFCYNIGRVVTALGPFLVGKVASGGIESMQKVLFWVWLVPFFGVLSLPWVIETKESSAENRPASE